MFNVITQPVFENAGKHARLSFDDRTEIEKRMDMEDDQKCAVCTSHT